jgi:hypothetical protein
MKFIFFLLFAGCLLTSQAQQSMIDVRNNKLILVAVNNSIGGNLATGNKYAAVVDGNAYFDQGWMKGSLVIGDGTEYQNLLLRLDLVSNVVEYKNEKGEHYIPTAPIKMLTLTDSVTNRSSYFIHSSAMLAKGVIATGWYQLLADGKVELYKYVTKSITESTVFGSATSEQKIVSTNQYYLLHDSSFSRVKKLKDLTDNLLSDKKELLTAFIDSHKLSGRNESDFSAVVAHYNGVREK